MPIRPEDRKRYPKDWKHISKRIREREGNACKWCKAPNGALVAREASGETYMLEDGRTYNATDGTYYGYRRGSEYDAARFVRIVLTVAHLDHTPEHNDDANLAALCQRCHLGHDRKQHASTARRTRARKRGQGELFPEVRP